MNPKLADDLLGFGDEIFAAHLTTEVDLVATLVKLGLHECDRGSREQIKGVDVLGLLQDVGDFHNEDGLTSTAFESA